MADCVERGTAALLTIELVKTGACTDLTGTTGAVSSAGASAVTQYPAQCASPVGGTSVTAQTGNANAFTRVFLE